MIVAIFCISIIPHFGEKVKESILGKCKMQSAKCKMTPTRFIVTERILKNMKKPGTASVLLSVFLERFRFKGGFLQWNT